MGSYGYVTILDKKKVEEWCNTNNITPKFNGWYEYEIFSHEVIVAYHGDEPGGYENVPCPFCNDYFIASMCDDEDHYELSRKLFSYSEIADWEVWT